MYVKNYASPRKISLKLDNWLLSCGQKQFSIWRPFAILNFRGPGMGSLKSLCDSVPIGRQ